MVREHVKVGWARRQLRAQMINNESQKNNTEDMIKAYKITQVANGTTMPHDVKLSVGPFPTLS